VIVVRSAFFAGWSTPRRRERKDPPSCESCEWWTLAVPQGGVSHLGYLLCVDVARWCIFLSTPKAASHQTVREGHAGCSCGGGEQKHRWAIRNSRRLWGGENRRRNEGGDFCRLGGGVGPERVGRRFGWGGGGWSDRENSGAQGARGCTGGT